MKVLKSALPNVGYVKIERDCDYNKQVGTLRRIKIYDFNVMDDGKHVATFMSRGMNRNYHLTDLSGKSVNIVGSIRLYIAVGRGFFDHVYSEAKQGNAIPPIGSEDAYSAWMVQGDKLAEERERNIRILEKSKEMFELLKQVSNTGTYDGAQLRTVINYVEGT